MPETPRPSGQPETTPSRVPVVTDRRLSPSGVMPRGLQTWLLAGLAAFMLLIMFVVGRPDAPTRPTSASAPVVPSADRVRDYQDRLRALETHSQAQVADPPPPSNIDAPPYREPPSSPPTDPLETEQRRREYESLFASNVVLSRRPEADRPDIAQPATAAELSRHTGAPSVPMPTMDDIADAALRATTRAIGVVPGDAAGTVAVPRPRGPLPSSQDGTAQRNGPAQTPERTERISPAGPLHLILEGTIVDAVLTNRLDGTTAAPVNCLVTNALYSHSGQHVLIPAGARLLGETKPVQHFGETRLAVAFHRLLLPDGRTYQLDQFRGLNQIGDAGLQDRVNHHYLATFGAAAAVGLVSGLSQLLGSAGLGHGDGNDRTVIVAGGMGEAASQATSQVLNRFLNRLPTVTIREGHRVKVYVTHDLELPVYVPPARDGSW